MSEFCLQCDSDIRDDGTCQCSDSLPDEDHSTLDETDEPDEDAITTPDHRRFYQSGKLVFTVEERKDGFFNLCMERKQNRLPMKVKRFKSVEAAIRSYMDHDQFWPDAWFISDHGNAHRINLAEAK